MTLKENATMSNVVLESPLNGISRLGDRVLSVDGKRVALGESAFMEIITLRGDAQDARFADAIKQVTGLALPVAANTASLGGGRQLVWLGPDEWILKAPLNVQNPNDDALESALRLALDGLHCSVVQVGSGYTTLTVQGEGAADLLARGCPLDFHPRVFAVGAVAQSHVAKAGATILCLEAGTRFELTVRRSFADYLFRWLCEAGAE
jgi:sarcosine oxidase subunit gamma